MNRCRGFLGCAVAGLALLCCQFGHAASEISSLGELKRLAIGKGAVERKFRVRGVVVCYDAGWHQLYVHDGRESLYFNADDFRIKPHTGQLVEVSGLAYGSDTFTNLDLVVLGQGEIPQAKKLELSELSSDHGEWIETAA